MDVSFSIDENVSLVLFFLPLRTIELPGVFFGFSINPARLFIVLAVIILGLMIACRPISWDVLFRSIPNRNPWVSALIAYFIFSILYYYAQVYNGQATLFGSDDFFFRSWRGRPIAQLLAILTYGLLPYYLIRYYARNEDCRRMIVRSITASIVVIIVYGFLQQALYFLGFSVTGRDLYEGRVATISAGGLSFLRFSSLGSEPRHVGSFLLIALPFYLFTSVGSSAVRRRLIILLILIAILMTFSTSAFIVGILSVIVIIIDAIIHGRIRLSLSSFKYPLLFLMMLALVLQQQLFLIFGARTQLYYQQFISTIYDKPAIVPYGIGTQSLDFVALYYLQDLPSQGLIRIFIGSGYGNFLTPATEVLNKYLRVDMTQDKHFSDTNSYFTKLFMEGGVVAVTLYALMVFHALRSNNTIIRAYQYAQRRDDYKRALLLRYCFIVSIIANSINISFYYFIIMALIENRQLVVLDSAASTKDQQKYLPKPPSSILPMIS